MAVVDDGRDPMVATSGRRLPGLQRHRIQERQPPTVLTQRRGASHGPPDGADNARRVEASVVEPRLRRRDRARRPRREAFGGLVDPPATLDGAAGSGPLARLALP
ncbi:hypothetical protein PG996_005633 [Apiospora saccharicola]|uniref:Uncharacterized protein n=1 Tax=Apiospora saccharicola TaxID=335842 RepID=A0ABR1VM25_9PEZI